MMAVEKTVWSSCEEKIVENVKTWTLRRVVAAEHSLQDWEDLRPAFHSGQSQDYKDNHCD